MIRKLEAFGAYSTGFLPASEKWTSATQVTIVPDAGRSGFAGDNAAFFDTSLGSVLIGTLACTAVDGLYTVTCGMAFQFATLTTEALLFSIQTAISQFDVVATTFGAIVVRQTSGGVYLGQICATADGVVPIGTGGCYIEAQMVFQTDLASAVTVRASDQYGVMNPLAQGALFALVAGEHPETLQIGGGTSDGPATFYMTDLYVTDGVRAPTVLWYNGRAIWNDGFLGNTHVQTFYATADGANLAVGNTPWTPDSGTTAYNRINEHPPDEDASYIAADTAGQLTTCLFASPEATPFGKVNCTAYAPIYGIEWDGRLRATGSAGSVVPIVRRVVTGVLADDVIEAGTAITVADMAYQYYPQVLDRDPTRDDTPWLFSVFVPAGVGVPGTTEFGIRLES